MDAVHQIDKNVFRFNDYKACLNSLVDGASQIQKGQKSRLAEFLRCQPAYISRVLNGDAHLSFEQAEAAARFFMLNKAESKFFLALMGEEKAGTLELKSFWREQREKALLERLELSGRAQLEMTLSEEDKLTYFSEWYHSAIHAALTVERLQTVDALASHLNLSSATVRKSLSFLCNTGVAQNQNERYVPAQTRLHLDKNSPLVGKHHLNWKIKAMEAINQPKDTDLRYTSVISLSRKDMDKVREAILKAIESIRATVKESKEETLACYQFDFFELERK